MPDIFSEPSSTTTQSLQPVQPIDPKPPIEQPTTLKSLGFFTTFCSYPKNLTFAVQESNEQILLFLRRDFITNVPWIFSSLLLFFFPPLILFIFKALQFSLFTLPHGFTAIFFLFYYILIVGFAFVNFISWFYNIGLITNKRVIDIDFYNISTVNVGTAIYPDIADAEYTQAGFFQSFFDYGDVRMRLESASEPFIFGKVPRPSEVTKLLSGLVGGSKNGN